MHYFTVYLFSGSAAKLGNTVYPSWFLQPLSNMIAFFKKKKKKLVVIGYKAVTWARSGAVCNQMHVYKNQIGTIGSYGPEGGSASLYTVSTTLKVCHNYTKS